MLFLYSMDMIKKNLKIKSVVMILLIGIFIFSCTKLILFYLDTQNNKKDSDKLVEEVIKNNDSEDIIKINFKKLSSINNDVIGWIKFNNGKVNNPIVQTKNNDYYLTHSFNKKKNQNGTIFMDYRNKLLNDKNVVLFGHASLDKSMFGSLSDVFKNDFFDNKENNYIQIIDKDNTILTYQIFSYYVIEKEEFYITTAFQNDKEFNNFLGVIKKRSKKDFDIEVSANDNILTLSTCHGTGGTSKRKVIHAKRIQNIKE